MKLETTYHLRSDVDLSMLGITSELKESEF